MANDLRRLLDSGALAVGDELYHPKRTGGGEITARLVGGGIEVGGQVYPSLSTAAKEVAGTATNGWTYWRLRRSGEPVAHLRATAD